MEKGAFTLQIAMTTLLLLVAASALVVTGQEPYLLVGEECDLTDPVGYLVPQGVRGRGLAGRLAEGAGGGVVGVGAGGRPASGPCPASGQAKAGGGEE